MGRVCHNPRLSGLVRHNPHSSTPAVRGACATTPVYRGLWATTPKRLRPERQRRSNGYAACGLDTHVTTEPRAHAEPAPHRFPVLAGPARARALGAPLPAA